MVVHYRIGVAPNIPDIMPCAVNMTNWNSPLPKACNRLGRYADLFSLLLSRMTIPLNYILVPQGYDYGVVDDTLSALNKNTTFTGNFGALQRGEVDMLVGSIMATPERVAHFDFMPGIVRVQAGILATAVRPFSRVEESMSFTRMFTPMLTFCFIFAWLCLLLGKHICRKFEVSPPWLLGAMGMLFTMHFTNIYKGSLLSAYILQDVKLPEVTFADVMYYVSNERVHVVLHDRTSSTRRQIRESKHPLIKQLDDIINKNKLVIYYQDNKTYALEEIANARAFMIDMDGTFLQSFLKTNCLLKTVPFNEMNDVLTYSTFAVRRGLPELSYQLRTLMLNPQMKAEFAFIDDVYTRNIQSNESRCIAKHRAEEHSRKPVNMINISGITVVHIIMCSTAIITFIFEHVYRKTRTY